jgi:hypothetical protein
VYLSDTGIYYRPVSEAQPVAAGDAPPEPVAGTLLYTF